jgi:hypothetical protein
MLQPTNPRDMPNLSSLLIVVVGNGLVVIDLLPTPTAYVCVTPALHG